MAQARETFHDKINLQQVTSKRTFVWPLNERRYATKITF